MTAKEYRQSAWNKLNGQWGTMALATLLSDLMTCAASLIGGVGVYFVGGPLNYSVSKMSLNIARGKQEKFENMFAGFKTNYLGTVLAFFLINIFTVLWMLLFVIPGIVKSYSYSMTYYIMADNPNMSANDARKRSMEVMRGHKWRLFCLNISFLGWVILSMFTFGILMYWITPYKNVAFAEFYRELVPETEVAHGSHAAGGRVCPKCGASTEKDAAFCTNCGSAMPLVAHEHATSTTVFCTNCGAKNDADSAFCTSCGAKIK